MMPLLLLILPFIFFGPTLGGFFAQDEWSGFGYYHLKSFQVIAEGLIPALGHYVPLNHVVAFSFFKSFGLDYWKYVIASICLHGVVTLLVYVFSATFTQNRRVAWATSLLFCLNPASHQATSWILADVNTHGATLLGLIAVIYVLRSKGKLAGFFLAGSLLFKEITIGLFIWVWATRKSSRLLFLGLAAYVILRLFGAYTATHSQNTPYVAPYLRTPKQIIYTFVTLPIKITTQSVIPPVTLLKFSSSLTEKFADKLSLMPETTAFDKFVENRMFELVNFVAFGLILLTVFLASQASGKSTKKLIWLSLFWVVINSFVYVLAPGKGGIIHEVESRNLYFPAVGSMLLCSLVLNALLKNKWIFTIVTAGLLLFYGFTLERTLVKLTVEGRVRKEIINQIKREYPDLPQKAAFYFESDKSYYGLPIDIKILPFQSGFGQTLLVWYQPDEKYPTGFFADNFLWDLESQGYQEIGDRGFGYFRDRKLLMEYVKKFNLKPENIISYRFRSRDNHLESFPFEFDTSAIK